MLMMHFFYLLFTFILALFFILLGTLSLLLPWSQEVREVLIQFIQTETWPWNVLGGVLFIIGASLLIQIWLSRRKRYHLIQVGLNEAIVSDKVLDDYLRSYFEKLFPTQEVPYSFTIKRHKLKITADLPFVPQEDQKKILEKMSEDLALILRDFLGYRKSMDLSISFENKKLS
jgi:hypothetical protein